MPVPISRVFEVNPVKKLILPLLVLLLAAPALSAPDDGIHVKTLTNGLRIRIGGDRVTRLPLP